MTKLFCSTIADSFYSTTLKCTVQIEKSAYNRHGCESASYFIDLTDECARTSNCFVINPTFFRSLLCRAIITNHNKFYWIYTEVELFIQMSKFSKYGENNDRRKAHFGRNKLCIFFSDCIFPVKVYFICKCLELLFANTNSLIV